VKRYCVVNTRALHQQPALTELCVDRGWDVLTFPCIGVELTNTTLISEHIAALDVPYAWLVLTSSNAVDAVAVAAKNRPLILPPVACVGAATALYAEERLGVRVTFVPSDATGSALAHQLPMNASKRILLPQSAIASPETAAIMRSRGAVVDVITAYTLHSGSGGDDVPNAVITGKVDAVMVTSPSALDGFLTRMEAAGVPYPSIERLIFAPIGPTTAKAIFNKSLHTLPIPTEHSLEGLIDVLACYFDRLETPNETVQT
jgi:uroporphyrinogen-III synthase